MKRPTWTLVAALSAGMLAGCGQTATEELGPGELAGNTYTHSYFNLEITLPDGWYVMGPEEMQQISDEGLGMMAGGSAEAEGAIEEARARTAHLVGAFQHPPDTPSLSNAAIIVVAERYAGVGDIETPEDYLRHVRDSAMQLLQSGQVQMDFDPIESGLQIGSLDAACMPMRMSILGMEIVQRQCVALHGDYALLISTIHSDDEAGAAIEATLSGIRAGE